MNYKNNVWQEKIVFLPIFKVLWEQYLKLKFKFIYRGNKNLYIGG